jgi:DNA-binding transcriptional LysR family regulator
MTVITVAYYALLPLARWGPMFHVFRLEQPEVTLSWRATEFPLAGRPLLAGADVGVHLHPPPREGLASVTLDASPLCVVMAAGHRLARHHELEVADVLAEPFPGGPHLDPEWASFWTLEQRRGAPAHRTGDDVRNAQQWLEIIGSGRAIGTAPTSMIDGLAHPGIVGIPLRDGPEATTALLWAADDDRPAIQALVELARAWSRT